MCYITAVNRECVYWCVMGGLDDAMLMLDPTNGLDLRSLTVGAPILPVLVVSTVPLTLHDVLPAPVAWELITHKTTHTCMDKEISACIKNTVCVCIFLSCCV